MTGSMAAGAACRPGARGARRPEEGRGARGGGLFGRGGPRPRKVLRPGEPRPAHGAVGKGHRRQARVAVGSPVPDGRLMKDGVCRRREEGTPQGGPLSPLLANVVLDELDKELERRGHRFCRYADDCNIYVRSRKAGERVMEGIRRFIERKLRLKVNETKSRVAPSGECKFLGYTIGEGGQLLVAAKSKERMKAKLKALTKRNRGRALGEVIGEVNRFAAGWLEYFRLAAAKSWLAETEGWLRRRLRCYRLRQCKRRIGVARFLMGCGCREDRAWMLAMSRKGWYRKSVTPQANSAMDTAWFRLQGLKPLALPTV